MSGRRHVIPPQENSPLLGAVLIANLGCGRAARSGANCCRGEEGTQMGVGASCRLRRSAVYLGSESCCRSRLRSVLAFCKQRVLERASHALKREPTTASTPSNAETRSPRNARSAILIGRALSSCPLAPFDRRPRSSPHPYPGRPLSMALRLHVAAIATMTAVPRSSPADL
jgi:hypothetical protein